MSDIHITRELLRAVASGELSFRILNESAWRHLMKLCPTCSEEMSAFEQERVAPSQHGTFQVLPLVLQKHASDLETKTGAAQRDFLALLRFAHAERLHCIQRASTRYKGVVLARMLLDEAKGHMPAEPHAAYELAEAAEAVLMRTQDIPGLYDLLARAVAYRANAERATGDLSAAGDTLQSTRGLIRNKGVTDPLVYAEVDWIEGALLKDQRRFKDAEELLIRAVNLYCLAGTKEEAAPPLITLGLLYYDRGDYQKAIDVTKAAAERMGRKADRRFSLCVQHNLALFLTESGDYPAAAEILHEDAELYQEFPDLWTKLRQTWLKGKIAGTLGDLAEAERLLGEARNGFILQNIGYDAAKVSVDLVRVYEQQGKVGG